VEVADPQELVTVYEIVVDPIAMPLTRPVEALTVAALVLVLVQEPPVGVAESEVVPNTATEVLPEIALTTGNAPVTVICTPGVACE
jgi:hypothetical protein